MKILLILFALFTGAFAADNATLPNADSGIGRKMLIDEITAFVRGRFTEFYKPYNIVINDISVAPAMDSNLNKMKLDKIVFDDRLLRRDSGNFEVHLYHNEKWQKTFFTFQINATIDALTASNNIKTGEVISAQNTQIAPTPITRALQLPALPNILDEYEAKSFIPSGSAIAPHKIAPKIIVQKGDILAITHSEGGISLNFSVKALESGHSGQIIRAQNTQSDKTISVKITSPKTAQMQ